MEIVNFLSVSDCVWWSEDVGMECPVGYDLRYYVVCECGGDFNRHCNINSVISTLPYFLYTSYYWCTRAGRSVLYDVEGLEGFERSGGRYKKRYCSFGLCQLKRALGQWRIAWDSWL